VATNSNARVPLLPGAQPVLYGDTADGRTPDSPPQAPFQLSPEAQSYSSGTSGSTASGTTVTASSSSGLTVEITWDFSVASAPAGFETAVENAVQYLESKISNPVTLNINVGYGEIDGVAMGSGALGESDSYLINVSYSQLRSALQANANSSVDQSVLASLPSTAPVNGNFWLTTAEAKALDLIAPLSTSIDGYVGFSSSYPFTYNDSSGVALGTYDFNGVVMHELTEVMGRLLLTGDTIGSAPNSYGLLDLLHYSSGGVRDFSASTPGYFSTDGGATALGAFNTASGDPGDWASTVTDDSFDAFSTAGVVTAVSRNDFAEMDAIGWNLSATAPTGVGTPVVEVACYAAGTRLATPGGEVAVEALRPGDRVLALADGQWTAWPVRWIGHATIDLTCHPRPERAAPVRLRAHAIAPGVPRRDLLLSPDHAVLLDGVLIQAQALLNGATVLQETPERVTYCHVELDRHAVLLAEGMMAESYLDTGNRARFARTSGVPARHADLASARAWAERACAPLILGGARLRAAHAQVLARAEALGFALTTDPDLQIRRVGDRVWLHSRSFVPAWLGQNDDRRRLGVAVASLRLNGRFLPRRAFGRGWHAPEPRLRWTDGVAELHLPHPGRLRVTLAAAGGRYWQAGAAMSGTATRAA
jgi:hypothetical protein